MSFFLELESLYAKLEDWQVSEETTKDDVIRQTRSCIAKIISSLLSTPHIGSAFCPPSDTLRVDQLQSNIDTNTIIFESDEVSSQAAANLK